MRWHFIAAAAHGVGSSLWMIRGIDEQGNMRRKRPKTHERTAGNRALSQTSPNRLRG
jgi:hypothetical protein